MMGFEALVRRLLRACQTLRLPADGPQSSVDPIFWNPFVSHGYRHVSTVWECIQSCLTWSNETLNIWSHLIPALFFLYSAVSAIHESRSKDADGTLFGDDAYFPLIMVQLSCSLMTFCSAMTHMFHSMSAWHHQALFIMDYFGIGVYSVASALAHYAYTRPSDAQSSVVFAANGIMYIYAAFCIHLWVFVTLVFLRLTCLQSPLRLYLLISSYALAYMVNFLPFLWRHYVYEEHLHSAPDHWAHFLWTVAGAVVLSLHVPECLSPELFSKIHSHAIMHILTAIGFACQQSALYSEVYRWRQFASNTQPSSTMVLFIVLVYGMICGSIGTLVARSIDSKGNLNLAIEWGGYSFK